MSFKFALCDSPMALAAALTELHEGEPGGKNRLPLPQGHQSAILKSISLRGGP